MTYAPLWGTSALLSTTVSAAPAPTSTVFTVASATGFMPAMYIETMVGGVFYRRQLASIVGNQFTLATALPGVPDVPGSVQFKGQLLSHDMLNGMSIAINNNYDEMIAIEERVADKIYQVDDRWGSGEDGYFYLGFISAPTGANIPTVSDSGITGNLTGTFFYKIAAYNMSGEQVATGASSSVTVTAKKIIVNVPAYSSVNITGFKIFRSHTGVGGPYYFVGKVTRDGVTQNNAAAGLSFTDNNPLTTGIGPVGGNTTTSSATLSGVYLCSNGILKGGETITVAAPGLFILSTDEFNQQSGSVINANGIGGTKTGIGFLGNGTQVTTWGKISGVIGNSIFGSSFMGLPADEDFLFGSSRYDWIGTQGGVEAGPLNQAGGTVWIGAKNYLQAKGTIQATGVTGITAGCAGGAIILASKNIDRAGGTFNCNGSSGFANHGGGGGGLIAFIYDNITGAAAFTLVNPGSSPGGGGGVSGGGFAGFGGLPGFGGSVGRIVNRQLQKTTLPRF